MAPSFPDDFPDKPLRDKQALKFALANGKKAIGWTDPKGCFKPKLTPLSKLAKRIKAGEKIKYSADKKEKKDIEVGGFQVAVRECGNLISDYGRRDSQQDAASVAELGKGLYLGLYDGHGPIEDKIDLGYQAASASCYKIRSEFGKAIRQGDVAPVAFVRAFSKMHEVCEAQHDRTKESRFLPDVYNHAGAVAATAFITDNHIFTAGCGDARVVLVDNGVAKRLTFDHKATEKDIKPSDKEGIINAGAYIDDKGYVRVEGAGGLAIPRTIGNLAFGKAISHLPDVFACERGTGEQVLVNACDGVWDVLSDQEVADIVNNSPDAATAAEEIIRQAIIKGSRDNITVQVVWDVQRAA
jgi:serine/threonine protein phosphatase PrpC